MLPQREGGQVNSRRPALGPGHQIGEIGLAELDAGDGRDELGGLAGFEAQFTGPDFGQFAGRPPAGQRQRRVSPGDQHEPDGWRKMQQQESELVVAAALGDHVIVIQHHDNRIAQPG